MSSLIGQLVANRYLVESLVARGGMATVYLARDQRLERKVALKVIHPHLANDASFQAKFVLEAKTAAQLSHPNLVNVFDQGTDGEITYLVMEYVQGITLRDALKDYGPLPPVRALEMLAQILAGLAAAHKAGILHRDLKPENVLLADDGRVKLGDFGLARAITAHTSSSSLVGTVAYLSPELVTRGNADARSDVYAAGIMLFELLTGKQPFEGEQAVQIAYQHANSAVPAPSSLRGDIPISIDKLVSWATAKLAQDRPADASELLTATNRLIATLKAPKTERTTVLDFDTSQMSSTAAGATEVISRGDATELISRSDPGARVIPSIPTEEVSPVSFATPVDATPTTASQRSGNSHTEVISKLDLEGELEPSEQVFGQRRVGLKLLIATLLVILLASGAGWWFGSGPGALSAIPQLTNRSVISAESQLSLFTDKVILENQNNSSIAKGLVIGTDPIAGSYVGKGSQIKVFVSLGPKMVAAPNLKSLNVAEATAQLLAAGFKLGAVNSWFASAPIGQVYDYQGSDGTLVAEGSAISLSVSLGPIPVVSGIDQAIAVAAIQATGLKVSSIEQQYSDTVATGKAIGLVPTSQPLGTGGSVKLLVSKGPNIVIMPKVVGETILAAQTLLKSVGLVPVVNTDQLQANWGIAKVKRSNVAVGTKLRAGDSVTISTK